MGHMNCIGKNCKCSCTAYVVHQIWYSFRCNSYGPWTPTKCDSVLKFKSLRPQNKTFKRGVSPCIPYEMWNEHAVGCQILNIATQERKICDIEVEIVMFVVKGSAQLTVPPVLVRSKSKKEAEVLLIFDLKLSGIHHYWLAISYRCIYMWSSTEILFLSSREQRLYGFRFVLVQAYVG